MDIDVENKEEDCNKTCQQVIGIIFVLVGQVCVDTMKIYYI